MKNVYIADFETTTDPKDCRVWGWGLYDIKNDLFNYGNSLKSFMKVIFKLPNSSKIYFHNLKFDLEFILYYLYDNGFKHSESRKLEEKEFGTLITDMGVFYSATIVYKSKRFNILDSLKVIPLPVSKISKSFNIEQLKGDIDYKMERPIGYQITDHEVEYIKNDVEIVGKAMLYFLNQNLNKMTQASNAFYDFKKDIGEKKFRKKYPMLSTDKDLRLSYKGGFTYVNPKYQGKIIHDGIVLDVNSLYPSVMYNERLPYGEPIFYQGKYIEDSLYELYIQKFRCQFELKKDYIPTIQLKNTPGFMPTEYATNSNGLDIVLCLTNVDLELFLKHYDVYNIEYFQGWKFKATDRTFKKYIDKWITIKNQASIDKNEGLRTIAKLMLNSLYGKFALNPKIKGKIPTFDGNMIHYKVTEEKERDPIYVPVASFITAYARRITISSAQENYDRFIYADTDSLHLEGLEDGKNIQVDQIKLGAWKVEYKFTRGKFLRAKAYIEELPDKTNHIACSGLPHKCHVAIDFENFKDGFEIKPNTFIDGKNISKLRAKRVKGGVVLEDTPFKITL